VWPWGIPSPWRAGERRRWLTVNAAPGWTIQRTPSCGAAHWLACRALRVMRAPRSDFVRAAARGTLEWLGLGDPTSSA
jgi:hypothetical protein